MEKDLRGAGYSTRALVEPHVREWDRWMRAVGGSTTTGTRTGSGGRTSA